MAQTIIYEWPDSQLCMECKHGRFALLPDSKYGSDYICDVGCKDNNGNSCPKFEQGESK